MTARAPITCHILDTVLGIPAEGVACTLSRVSGTNASGEWIASGKTDGDGRITQWNNKLDQIVNPETGLIVPGVYWIRFDTGAYTRSQVTAPQGKRPFFPYVDITFEVSPPADKHYHIPLLLSNYSYSTYRGS